MALLSVRDDNTTVSLGAGYINGSLGDKSIVFLAVDILKIVALLQINY